jgi:hypothetical protein
MLKRLTGLLLLNFATLAIAFPQRFCTSYLRLMECSGQPQSIDLGYS